MRGAAAILHNHLLVHGIDADLSVFDHKELFQTTKQKNLNNIISKYGKTEDLPCLSTHWLYYFLSSHSLSFKKPTNLTKHAYSLLLPSILEFLTKFMHLVASNLYDDSLIINCDQTPINRAYTPGSVIGIKGVPTHVNGVSGEKNRVTVMFGCTMKGTFIAPFIVGKSSSHSEINKITEITYRNPSKYDDFAVPPVISKSTVHAVTASISMNSKYNHPISKKQVQDMMDDKMQQGVNDAPPADAVKKSSQSTSALHVQLFKYLKPQHHHLQVVLHHLYS